MEKGYTKQFAWDISLGYKEADGIARNWRRVQQLRPDLAGSKRKHRKEVLAPEKQRELEYNTKK